MRIIFCLLVYFFFLQWSVGFPSHGISKYMPDSKAQALFKRMGNVKSKVANTLEKFFKTSHQMMGPINEGGMDREVSNLRGCQLRASHT